MEAFINSITNNPYCIFLVALLVSALIVLIFMLCVPSCFMKEIKDKKERKEFRRKSLMGTLCILSVYLIALDFAYTMFKFMEAHP